MNISECFPNYIGGGGRRVHISEDTQAVSHGVNTTKLSFRIFYSLFVKNKFVNSTSLYFVKYLQKKKSDTFLRGARRIQYNKDHGNVLLENIIYMMWCSSSRNIIMIYAYCV